MGNFQDQDQPLSARQWQLVSLPNTQIPGQPSICRSMRTKILTQQYLIDLSLGNFESAELEIYDKRQSSNSGHLVNVIGAERVRDFCNCSPLNTLLNVRTEFIPWRFSNFESITVPEAIYLLDGIFQGFEELLLHTHQPFHVSDKMIGISQIGIVKVWANSNFARNRIESTMNSKCQKITTEEDMVREVIDIIKAKLPNHKFDGLLGYQLQNSWKVTLQIKKILMRKYLHGLNKIQIREKIIQKLKESNKNEQTESGSKRGSQIQKCPISKIHTSSHLLRKKTTKKLLTDIRNHIQEIKTPQTIIKENQNSNTIITNKSMKEKKQIANLGLKNKKTPVNFIVGCSAQQKKFFKSNNIKQNHSC